MRRAWLLIGATVSSLDVTTRTFVEVAVLALYPAIVGTGADEPCGFAEH